MTSVTQCCKSPHTRLHSKLCNKLTLSYHRPFAAVQCQLPLLFVPTIRELKRRQFSELPFVAGSEIVPEPTQVSEAFETEPSTTLLPFSVSVLLGLLCEVTSSSAYAQYYWVYCVK